jgi:alkylation response protein AidB-like acyl-CoA dehydrogenase
VDFNLSADQVRLKNAVREWAQAEVAPMAEELDREAVFPVGLYRKVGEMGITSIPFPQEYGGMGLGTLDMVVAVEELARADQSLAVSTFVSVTSGLMVLRYGSEEQKRKYLPGIASGATVGAFAGTEPEAGSDTYGFKTRARRKGQRWMINGQKAYITNPGTEITSFVGVMAVSSDPGAERKSFTMFVIPAGTPGCTPGEPYKKMGWRSSDTRPVYFDDCEVGLDALLGDVGKGRFILHRGYQQGRCFLAASSLGLAQASLDHALAYAQERHAFGAPIGKLQLIQELVAQMAVKVDAARLLTYRASWMTDQGMPNVKEGSIAKLYATEIASECANAAIQVHGGWGFMDDCPPSRYLRDNRICTIGDGASQIQTLVIARELGLPVEF